MTLKGILLGASVTWFLMTPKTTLTCAIIAAIITVLLLKETEYVYIQQEDVENENDI